MRDADLDRVHTVAEQVHPAFPEDAAVFTERLRLYSKGCLVFENESGVAGYVISHPWRENDAPALNTRLGRLPDKPSTYYIHDLALLPDVQGIGAAALAVALLVARARADNLAAMSLVAVNGSAGFWARHGFHQKRVLMLADKLRSYDASAMFMVRRLT